MSNIDKFITFNFIKELDNKAAEVVSGGQDVIGYIDPSGGIETSYGDTYRDKNGGVYRDNNPYDDRFPNPYR